MSPVLSRICIQWMNIGRRYVRRAKIDENTTAGGGHGKILFGRKKTAKLFYFFFPRPSEKIIRSAYCCCNFNPRECVWHDDAILFARFCDRQAAGAHVYGGRAQCVPPVQLLRRRRDGHEHGVEGGSRGHRHVAGGAVIVGCCCCCYLCVSAAMLQAVRSLLVVAVCFVFVCVYLPRICCSS